MQFNKTIILLFITAALVFSSCKKKNDDSSGGSWTFKSVTYKAGFANWVLGNFTGYTGTNIPTSALTFTFYDSISNATIDTLLADSLPVPGHPAYTIPKNNSYHLTDQNPPDSGYVYVVFSDTSISRYYHSRPSNSNVVNVVHTGDGKINLEFPGFQMFNTADRSDSSLLTGSLRQTP